MSPERANLILRRLGWKRRDFLRYYSRVTGKQAGDDLGYLWFAKRGLSGEAQVCLRLAVRTECMKRRLARLREVAAGGGNQRKSKRA